jgi:hypothetical protein
MGDLIFSRRCLSQRYRPLWDCDRASDRSSAEAALGRYLLWCALLLNLRINTWEHPQPEALGVLTAMETTAEKRLKELLVTPDLCEPDFR